MSDRRREQRGSVILLMAVLGMALIAFMGLAFDASYTYYLKRKLQTAADAGAIAGAQELLRGAGDQVTAAARKDTALNRFAHGVGNVSVTVNNPPLTGSRAGDTNFVEVIVSKPGPIWFLRAVGATASPIRARAVSGLTGSTGCLYALNRDSSHVNNGVFVNGTADTSISCGVFSNANLRAVGGGCIVTPEASYTGTYTNSNSSDPNCGPTSVGHGISAADPLANRYSIPATSPCSFTNYKQTSGAAIVLAPGVYCGGIEIGGSVPSVTFSAGTYVLAGGGLKIGSGVSATGNGVTFYNTFPGTQVNKYEPVMITTSSDVNLVAPTSGAHKALLFYQDPRITWHANNGSVLTSGSGGTFQGIIYFPSTDLTYAGSSSASVTGNDGYTVLIGYNVKIAGNARVNADYSTLGNTNPVQMATFAE